MTQEPVVPPRGVDDLVDGPADREVREDMVTTDEVVDRDLQHDRDVREELGEDADLRDDRDLQAERDLRDDRDPRDDRRAADEPVVNLDAQDEAVDEHGEMSADDKYITVVDGRPETLGAEVHDGVDTDRGATRRPE